MMKSEKKGEKAGELTYAARYRQIISIFTTYGFSDIAGKIRSWGPGGGTKKRDAAPPAPVYNPCGARGQESALKTDPLKMTHNERVRHMFEELGPTYIKLGQLLSGRPDLVDPALARELEKLQDAVPPFPGEEAEKIIEADLGKPIRLLFLSFDRTPIASASIAQVHRATLNNGTPAAVKVRRPDIEHIIALDIRIMKDLARFAQKHVRYLSFFQPVSLIDAFSKGLEKELDFGHEMENLRRFTEYFDGTKHLRIPRCYPRMSTSRVFVMEFMTGRKISCAADPAPVYAEKHRRQGGYGAADRRKADSGHYAARTADYFVTLVLDQIFEAGYFHGDPHPGNILVMENGDVCFIDFGIMGSITSQQKECLTKMLIAIPPRNMQRFTRALLGFMGISHMPRFDELAQTCGALLDTYLGGTLEDIELGRLLNDLMKVVVSFNIAIPPTVTLMAKAMTAAEAVALQLDPRFNILDKLTPYIRKLAGERLSLRKALPHGVSTVLAYSEFLRDMPENANELFNMITSGNTTLKLEIKEMPQTISTLDTIANRLVFGLITAALLISSSIIVFAKIPPLWRNFSLIGAAGFFLSAFMAFVFVITQFVRMFRRNGRKRDKEAHV